MSAHPTVVRFEDWPIAVAGFEDGAQRILDVELGKKLGFGRPRDIRKTIERFRESGELPMVQTRDTVSRVARKGRGTVEIPVTEYWLTMDEALFITAKSETKVANRILKAVIRVFLAAREEIERQQMAQAGGLARLLLAKRSCEHDEMWTRDWVEAACKLYGVAWDGGPHPRFLGAVQAKIYVLLLTSPVYAKLKGDLCPDPSRGNNLHQWLNPSVREVLRQEIPAIIRFARHAASPDDFWAHLEHEYRGTMLQLSFGGRAA